MLIDMELMTPPGRVVGAQPLFRQLVRTSASSRPSIGRCGGTRDSAISRPGERLLVLALDILGCKSALYRMVERWAVTDMPILRRIAADFSDDSGARLSCYKSTWYDLNHLVAPGDNSDTISVR